MAAPELPKPSALACLGGIATEKSPAEARLMAGCWACKGCSKAELPSGSTPGGRAAAPHCRGGLYPGRAGAAAGLSPGQSRSRSRDAQPGRGVA